MRFAKIALITLIFGVALLLSGATWAMAQAPVDIGLAPAKKAQLKAFGGRVRERAQSRRAALKLARVSLARVYSEYDLDPRKIQAADAALDMAQRDLLNMHLNNQIALRKILNEDEFKRFDAVMQKRMHHRHADPAERAAESFSDMLTDPAMMSKAQIAPSQVRCLRAMPDHKPVMDKLKRDIGQMTALYGNYDLDVVAARKLIDVVHRDQTQMTALTRRRQMALRSVLTSDEFEEAQSYGYEPNAETEPTRTIPPAEISFPNLFSLHGPLIMAIPRENLHSFRNKCVLPSQARNLPDCCRTNENVIPSAARNLHGCETGCRTVKWWPTAA